MNIKPWMGNQGPLITYGRPIICTACPCPDKDSGGGSGKLPPRPSYQPPPPGAITTKCGICTSLHWDENDIPGVDSTPESVFVILPGIFQEGYGSDNCDCQDFNGAEIEVPFAGASIIPAVGCGWSVGGPGAIMCEKDIAPPLTNPYADHVKTGIDVSVYLSVVANQHLRCIIECSASVVTSPGYYPGGLYQRWEHFALNYPGIYSGKVDCGKAFQYFDNKEFELMLNDYGGAYNLASCYMDVLLPLGTKKVFRVSL